MRATCRPTAAEFELVEPGVSPAPIRYERGRFDDGATAALVATVRASVTRACSVALDDLAVALPTPVVSISPRFCPPDFPDDIAVQRRAPYEARADAIMYLVGPATNTGTVSVAPEGPHTGSVVPKRDADDEEFHLEVLEAGDQPTPRRWSSDDPGVSGFQPQGFARTAVFLNSVNAQYARGAAVEPASASQDAGGQRLYAPTDRRQEGFGWI